MRAPMLNEHPMVINAVFFHNLLLINLFRYILADDNLLEKGFGTPRKNIAQMKSCILVWDSVNKYAII